MAEKRIYAITDIKNSSIQALIIAATKAGIDVITAGTEPAEPSE